MNWRAEYFHKMIIRRIRVPICVWFANGLPIPLLNIISGRQDRCENSALFHCINEPENGGGAEFRHKSSHSNGRSRNEIIFALCSGISNILFFHSMDPAAAAAAVVLSPSDPRLSTIVNSSPAPLHSFDLFCCQLAQFTAKPNVHPHQILCSTSYIR